MNLCCATDWAYESWGKTSEAIRFTTARSSSDLTAARSPLYAEGQPFQPQAYFGDAFRRQIEAAARPGPEPLVNFFRTRNGVARVPSQALQPFETSAQLPKLSVLTFYKELTQAAFDTDRYLSRTAC